MEGSFFRLTAAFTAFSGFAFILSYLLRETQLPGISQIRKNLFFTPPLCWCMMVL
jgi:hypothetical protein